MADRLEQMKVTRERRTKKEGLPFLKKSIKYVTDLFPAAAREAGVPLS